MNILLVIILIFLFSSSSVFASRDLEIEAIYIQPERPSPANPRPRILGNS